MNPNELALKLHKQYGGKITIALRDTSDMTRQKLSPDAAHRFLTDISHRTSRPLLGICQEVVKASFPSAGAHSSDPGEDWR